ncbi:MAG: ISAzo13 family transposase [Chloroflexota bacterium]
MKALEKILKDATAGDPITGLKWTRKTCRKIAKELKRKGFQVEHSTISRLVQQLGYILRVNHKRLSRKKDKRRDQQMRYIESLRKRFARKKQPEISVDGKKKEKIGQFRNPGRTLRKKSLDVLATDFLTDAIGKAALYGVYDIQRNEGFMAVGVSHETAEFAGATIQRWLLEIGCVYYKNRNHLLIQADSGGANASDSWLWKVELQKLADEFQLAITVTHYPPGTSKWNLIEHRMFSVISQNWAGQPLVSYETVLKFIRTSKTETDFHCSAYFDRKHYQTKRKVTLEEKANVNLYPHKLFPEWNYTIRPNSN